MPVAERFLLVEDDRTVPYARLRLTSSRDYRRPPEVCVTVEPDGVTLALDPARADLLVDAELAQFADPARRARTSRSGQSGTSLPRRFVITGDSLQRGINRGMSPRLAERMVRASRGEADPGRRRVASSGEIIAQCPSSRPRRSWS